MSSRFEIGENKEKKKKVFPKMEAMAVWIFGLRPLSLMRINKVEKN